VRRGDEQLRGSVGMGLPGGGHHADDLLLHLGQRQPAGLLAALQAPPAQPGIEPAATAQPPAGHPRRPRGGRTDPAPHPARPRAGGIPGLSRQHCGGQQGHSTLRSIRPFDIQCAYLRYSGSGEPEQAALLAQWLEAGHEERLPFFHPVPPSIVRLCLTAEPVSDARIFRRRRHSAILNRVGPVPDYRG
jgi:hypothetical protein